MKLRTILFTINLLSVLIMIGFLAVAYVKMVLSIEMILILSGVTLTGGLISVLAHYLMTRPLLHSIQQAVNQSKRIARGDFNAEVPSSKGPLEMQDLAKSFNDMNQQLKRMFTQLSQSEESRKQLIANVSHDLRTPLSSIQSYVEALQDGVVKDQASKEKYLKTILEESERLDLLIDHLFQLSQLQAGNHQFDPVIYHIDQLLLESIQTFELKLEKGMVKVDVVADEKLQGVKMVPHQIRRVLTNLIQNAIYFSPAHSTIRIEARKISLYELEISVEDEGVGIDAIELDKIFERFYRVEQSRNTQLGGSGLGLAIAKEIVLHHGGTIGVESVVGTGSRFWFRLPIE